jgi:AAA family ATP:ADP antiporter
MLKRLLATIFGKFESNLEVKKYVILGFIFGTIIATYWAMRPLKNSIFGGIVGVDFIPRAKMISLVAILLLVFFYTKLVDLLPRHKVFYILSGIYIMVALGFAYFLSHPVYGLPNTVESPTRIIGWLWYVFVESFGTIWVPLFWAFSADVSTPDSAKRGFPMIMLFAQVGNIIGPWFLRGKKLGFVTDAPVVGIIAVLILLIGVLIWTFMHVIPKSELRGYQVADEVVKKKKPGFFEGLKLLFSHGYLLGIFLFLFAFEVVNTIIDFYFNVLAKAAYPVTLDRSNYLAGFAVVVGIVSSLSLIFGISNIQRKLGMKASLITMPLLVAVGVLFWRLNPTLSITFWVLVALKAINYALNQPSIKQLYIPTTKDTRYKAQAWIEVFGSRGSKAAGSAVNDFKLNFTQGFNIFGIKFNGFGETLGLSYFLTMSTAVSLGLAGIWIFVAFYVAQKYNKAIKEDTIVC